MNTIVAWDRWVLSESRTQGLHNGAFPYYFLTRREANAAIKRSAQCYGDRKEDYRLVRVTRSA